MAQLRSFFRPWWVPFCFSASVCLGADSAPKTWKIELQQEILIPSDQKLDGEKVGGLSALAWHEGKLWLLSDDRGLKGKPRFFEAKLPLAARDGSATQKSTLTWVKTHFFSKVPSLSGAKPRVLDLEAWVRMENGDFWISNEGDGNRKPREAGSLLRVSSDGAFQEELSWPEEFRSNPVGLQTQGVANNLGFEGLTRTPEGQICGLTERGLVQDAETNLARLLCLRSQGKTWNPSLSLRVPLEKSVEGSREVFRGMSELLALEEKKFLALERGLSLGREGELLHFRSQLHLLEIQGETVKKTKLLDLVPESEGGLKGLGKGRNFEGLAWGPSSAQQRILLVVSDNNFSSGEESALLILHLREVSP